RASKPVLELSDAVEELTDENGAGIVEAEIAPQPLRFGQPRSADGRKQRCFARARTSIEEPEGEIAASERDSDPGLSGDHGQLDCLLDGLVCRSRRRSAGAHRPPSRASK